MNIVAEIKELKRRMDVLEGKGVVMAVKPVVIPPIVEPVILKPKRSKKEAE